MSLYHQKHLIHARDFREVLSKGWSVEDTTDEGLVVHGPSSRVYLVNVDPSTEVEPGERHVYLNYSEEALVKQVIVVIADDPDLLVENGWEFKLPGDQFVAKIRNEPDWWWNPLLQVRKRKRRC